MIIDVVYKAVLQLMAKHIVGGYLSPAEFNRYALIAQNQKLDEDLEKYRTTNNSENLSNFIVSDLPLTVINGYATKPSNYMQFESAYYTDFSTGNPYLCAFEELESDRFNWRLGSELDTPSLDYPALVVRDGVIQVSPKEIDFFNLTYVKYPENPVWGYVTPVVSRYVYSEANSTDFTYDEDEIPDLVNRIAKLAGVETGNSELYGQMNNEQQQTK